jgi:hypothetical protein
MKLVDRCTGEDKWFLRSSPPPGSIPMYRNIILCHCAESLTQKGQFYCHLGSESTNIITRDEYRRRFHVKSPRGTVVTIFSVSASASWDCNTKRQTSWYTQRKWKCRREFGITMEVCYSSSVHVTSRVREIRRTDMTTDTSAYRRHT